MEALLAQEKKYEARVRIYEKSLAEAKERLEAVKAQIAEMKAAESESESEAESPKPKAEEPKPKAEEPKAEEPKPKPASQVPNMDDKYLLLPEQFTVGAEFNASNKQTYVVSDKEHKLPRKIGDAFYMKKKGGKSNIRFNVAYDFRVIQSEKSDYAFTEKSYEDEFYGTGAQKFYKPDGTKMTFKEAKAKFGGTYQTGQINTNYNRKQNISLGYLKKTSAQAAPAPAPAPKKAEAPITIPKKEFIAEHKELVQVLKKDEPKAVAKEAKKQEAELKDVSPPAKATNGEIREMIKERLKKHGKTASVSKLNRGELLVLYKQVMAKYN